MKRYLALDALRGLTIALMILVNTPGSWSHVYAPLLHADWHGCTPTDLVFPFFLFIIGSAMYFSFQKIDFKFSLEQANKVIKRGMIMFIIGLLLNAYPFIPLEDLRILGVLQRIGLAYIMAGLIVLLFKRKGILIISIALLVGYWLLLLSSGAGTAFTLEGNIVRQFDLFILGGEHIYSGKGVAFDPEGLLSTFPAVVNMLIGFEITRFITTRKNKEECVKQLTFIGACLLLIAMLWGTLLPINKSLWTSSFVLFSSGIACITLAVFIYIIDIKNIDKPVSPLLVYGTNPLFIYVLSWVWVATYFYIDMGSVDLHQWIFGMLSSFMNASLASFIFALSHVVLFWYISRMLYLRKIFIKI
jgi:predicted acyltransferase